MAGKSIAIAILGDTKDFTKKLDSTVSKLGGFGKKVGTMVGIGVAAAAGAGVKLIKDVTEATGAWEQAAGGVESVFKGVSDQVKKAGESAFKMGMSATDFMASQAKLGSLMQGNGLSAEQAWARSEGLMTRAADMATVMGISTADANRAIEGMAKGNFTMMDNLGVAMNDTTLKAYALEKGLDYTTTADKNAVAFEYFMDKTKDYAGNAAKEASQTIEGSLGMLKASWTDLIAGMGRSDADITALVNNVSSSLQAVVSNITPVVQSVASSLPAVFAGLIPAILALLPTILQTGVSLILTLVQGVVSQLPTLLAQAMPILMTLIQGIVEMLPTLLTTGIEILLMLVDGIIEALPTLVPVAVDTLLKLVDALVDNLDLIIDAAITLIITLAIAMIDALPKLAKRIPEIVTKICDTLIDHIDDIIQAGVDLLEALIENLPQIIETIVAAIPKIVTGITDKFKENWPKIQKAGEDLLKGIWQGISDTTQWLKDKVFEIGGKIVGWVKGVFGIQSPSKVFAEMGRMNILGLAKGLEETRPVESAMAALAGLVNGTDLATSLAEDTLRRGGTVIVVGDIEVAASNTQEASIIEQFASMLQRKTKAGV